MGTSVLSKPILFTKPPIFTMPYHYVKVPACSCPHPFTLQLTGALKLAEKLEMVESKCKFFVKQLIIF